MTLCGDDYLLVPALKRTGPAASDGKEVVADEKKASKSPLDRGMVTRLMATSIKRAKTVKAVLVLDLGAVTGSANTALTTVIPCDLTGCGDYSSWLQLFDEVRVNSVKLVATIGGTATATAALSTLVHGTISFDPCDATAVSGVTQNLKATHHVGPFLIGNVTGTTIGTNQFCSTLATTSQKGYVELGPIKLVPQLPKNSAGTMGPSPVGSDWVPTTDAAIVAAYFKFYCEAPGASLAWRHRSYVFFDVEFLMRG
jgi:hypothetical protein